jgi:hypothetical protein
LNFIDLSMKYLFIRSLLVCSMFNLYSQKIVAQGITMEQTLAYVNGKFGGICQLDVLRGLLIAKYYDGKEVFREDQVLCKSLNMNSMKYDKELRMLTIDCSGAAKCVDRQLFVRKIQRDYNRISFPVTLDPKSEAGMKKALVHMVNLVLDPKYKSAEPFE